MPGRNCSTLAERAGSRVRFEAAVAGGVPVVRAIEHGLAGDRLTRVAGILNGTCNYILSRMERDGVEFRNALAEAQALGFAEADPSQDIEGFDAQAKLAILAHVALRAHVRAGAIEATADRRDRCGGLPVHAQQMGCTIRQIAWAERTDDPGDRAGGGRSGARAARIAAGTRPRQRESRDAARPVWRRDDVRRARRRRRADGGRGDVRPAGDRARSAARSARGRPRSRAEVTVRVREPVLRPVHRRGSSGHHRDAGDGVRAARHQHRRDPAAARDFPRAAARSSSASIRPRRPPSASAMDEIAAFDFHGVPPVALPVLSSLVPGGGAAA